LTYLEGDLDQAIRFDRAALEQLPDGDARARAYVASDLATWLGRAGSQDYAAATAVLEAAISTSLSAGDLPTAIFAHSRLVGIYSASGQLNKLLDTSKEALRLSRKHATQVGYRTPAIRRVYVLAGGSLYHQNDLATAERYIRESTRLSTQSSQPQDIASGYATLARILQAMGAREEALAAMHQACEIGERVSPWFASFGAAWKALLQLEQGNLGAAVQWAQECGLRFDDAVSQNTYVKHIILARVLVAQGWDDSNRVGSGRHLEQAVHLLDRLVDLAESTEAYRYLIESLVVRAVALQAQGRPDRAYADISRALTLAKPEGFVRLFVNEGSPIEALLKRAVAKGTAVDYARHLLAELAKETPVSATAPQRTPLISGIDPLTERELDVLRLLPTHLSSTEIAEQFYVSKNTVRSHIGHIYDKLGVHSREEAVQRARELGLL
jgi:LuxR family maltose regulon positive regulatory protein